MWLLPDEHRHLFCTPADGGPVDMVNGEAVGDGDLDRAEEAEMSAGDGGNLLEITGWDLARRCLELVGTELGLSI
jgi:hypothetical protein